VLRASEYAFSAVSRAVNKSAIGEGVADAGRSSEPGRRRAREAAALRLRWRAV